jgi:5'-3' exonuclease
VKVHLVDGTYELFRSYFGAPKAIYNGQEVGATRGIIRSLHALLREPDVTHVGVAFDTVIESFRNDLFDGYKTSFGVPDDLMSQFPLAEQATEALGMVTWRMIEFEADDALATYAARAAANPAVDQVVICSPDKDLRQCVRGTRVVCLDRLRKTVIDEDGVIAKFGIPPRLIPDWLALVGDDADGIPGVPRWGAKSAAQVLALHGHVDDIPDDVMRWKAPVRGSAALAGSLREHRVDVQLYRTLATLREDAPLSESLEDLEWRGARRAELTDLCTAIGDTEFLDRVERWR